MLIESSQGRTLHPRDPLAQIQICHQSLKQRLARRTVRDLPGGGKWRNVLIRVCARLQKPYAIHGIGPHVRQQREIIRAENLSRRAVCAERGFSVCVATTSWTTSTCSRGIVLDISAGLSANSSRLSCRKNCLGHPLPEKCPESGSLETIHLLRRRGLLLTSSGTRLRGRTSKS